MASVTSHNRPAENLQVSISCVNNEPSIVGHPIATTRSPVKPDWQDEVDIEDSEEDVLEAELVEEVLEVLETLDEDVDELED